MKLYQQAGWAVSFTASKAAAKAFNSEFAYKIVNFKTNQGIVDMLEINPDYKSVRYRINGLYYFEHELILVND